MKRFIIQSAWLVCFLSVWVCPFSAWAHSFLGSSSLGSLRVPSKQFLVGGGVRGQELRLPPKQSLRLLEGSEWGTLKQSQTAPPPGGAAPLPFFPSAGTLEFNLFVMEIGILVGGIVVSIGTSIASQMRADLTGWKVAGIVLDGLSLGTSVLLLSTIDLKAFDPMFSVLIWASFGISALMLVWNVIRLVLYIDKRNKMKEREEKGKAQPVALIPWGGVDPSNGHAMGGFALTGHF